MARASLSIRRVFLAVHRWIALILFVLLVPVALSGALRRQRQHASAAFRLFQERRGGGWRRYASFRHALSE